MEFIKLNASTQGARAQGATATNASKNGVAQQGAWRAPMLRAAQPGRQ